MCSFRGCGRIESPSVGLASSHSSKHFARAPISPSAPLDFAGVEDVSQPLEGCLV